ncbi:MAG: 50S ribosomal protein L29 [Bacteroidales bacterium]|nr:50S ribosomal protein L29 [Bacteroidales bacterium]MBN2818426.1 50S ribosomal protein L29 [Bacteroidales bacterium]
MKASEIRELTIKEIVEQIENEESLLSKQRLNHTVSPLDNPQKLKETRRNIARLKTILRDKELKGENK